MQQGEMDHKVEPIIVEAEVKMDHRNQDLGEDYQARETPSLLSAGIPTLTKQRIPSSRTWVINLLQNKIILSIISRLYLTR
jgi:hypothetical protein